MAKTGAVWGIDIGQCALKAMRCLGGGDKDKDTIVVDAFDYIEYPKILSQPEADPDELIQEALATFLSRNSLKGDRVAMSVSGQSGLARFIKLPPVEKKKIPDIVKYEARQQIPFALEDVIWDYQQMAGGSEEDGFALEAKVGLFAMKREQVFGAIAPLEQAGIDIDIIQLTPLALYNYAVFDQLRDLPSAEEYDPDNPPPSVVVISIGTDTTDLVVTDGFDVWQRNIPLGGNHFTKALTKELKLTFAKAEHLKRNAEQAEDPRAVYQAMRPVFNDLVTEIMRSINYFLNLEKGTKISRAILLGNAMKLPGLESYLSKYLKDEGKGLDIEIEQVKSFPGLKGASVVEAPSFKENQLSFGVAYGLALQGLGRSKLKTNLIPVELVIVRKIRSKKPWVVAGVSALLLGLCLNFVGGWWGWKTVHPEKYRAAFSKAKQTKGMSDTLKGDYKKAEDEFARVDVIGQQLVGIGEDRLQWAELYTMIAACVPREPAATPEERKAKWEKPIDRRNELHIERIECAWDDNLEKWYAGVHQFMKNAPGAAAKDASAGDSTGRDAAGAGPKGPGWIVEMKGYHYHSFGNSQAAQFVLDTLVKNLLDENKKVTLPGRDQGPVTAAEFGLAHPVLVGKQTVATPVNIPHPWQEGETVAVSKYDFKLQFVWVPTSPGEKRPVTDQPAPAVAGAP